ncbi:hypothetical protein, partial [Stenotrophomonas maltophilia]|uniref:hypothetical protein n=1 Tax=Stenotrophomonas maltophilia TaxID=40324 RepID=UPI0019530A7C
MNLFPRRRHPWPAPLRGRRRLAAPAGLSCRAGTQCIAMTSDTRSILRILILAGAAIGTLYWLDTT